jgi:hypothetical protein
MNKFISKKLHQPKTYIFIILILLGVILYLVVSPKIVVNPLSEKEKLSQLNEIKEEMQLNEFETDGCSGNISESWTTAINKLSEFSDELADKYSDQKNIPFEYACVEHDKKYHAGEGGYVGRLEADNELRSDIINYGIINWKEVTETTPLGTKEEVVFIFEKIAEVVYRGVRIGGAPCTGQPYAWGFGYNNGSCEIE